MSSRLTVRDAVAEVALACRIAGRVIACEGRIADDAMRERLEMAAAHLNRLELYPRPIELSRVTVYHAPWFFTMRHNRGFIGVAMRNRLLFRQHPHTVPDHVLRHELCHIWQMQHRPLRMPLSFLNRKRGYWNNPYEVEARRAMLGHSAPVSPDGAGATEWQTTPDSDWSHA